MLLGLHYMKVVSVSSHCWTPGSSRRWVTAQRRAMSAGLLSGDKLELLQELAFEPDEDEAEWLRWFMDLARCGPPSIPPFLPHVSLFTSANGCAGQMGLARLPPSVCSFLLSSLPSLSA